MVDGGGGGGGGGEGSGRTGERLPTHNHVFSIADGKVDDNMTIVL